MSERKCAFREQPRACCAAAAVRARDELAGARLLQLERKVLGRLQAKQPCCYRVRPQQLPSLLVMCSWQLPVATNWRMQRKRWQGAAQRQVLLLERAAGSFRVLRLQWQRTLRE